MKKPILVSLVLFNPPLKAPIAYVLFKMMKGYCHPLLAWSHFFQKKEDTSTHFNHRAHLEIGEEALSLRYTFVLLFPEAHQ